MFQKGLEILKVPRKSINIKNVRRQFGKNDWEQNQINLKLYR